MTCWDKGNGKSAIKPQPRSPLIYSTEIVSGTHRSAFAPCSLTPPLLFAMCWFKWLEKRKKRKKRWGGVKKMRQKRQNYTTFCDVKGRLDMNIQINDIQVHSQQMQMEFDSRDFLSFSLYTLLSGVDGNTCEMWHWNRGYNIKSQLLDQTTIKKVPIKSSSATEEAEYLFQMWVIQNKQALHSVNWLCVQTPGKSNSNYIPSQIHSFRVDNPRCF